MAWRLGNARTIHPTAVRLPESGTSALSPSAKEKIEWQKDDAYQVWLAEQIGILSACLLRITLSTETIEEKDAAIVAGSKVQTANEERMIDLRASTLKKYYHLAQMPGIISGGCCISESISTTASASQWSSLALIAYSLPKLRLRSITLMRGSRSCSAKSWARVSPAGCACHGPIIGNRTPNSRFARRRHPGVATKSAFVHCTKGEFD